VNTRQLISSLQGQNPESELFVSVGGELYDVTQVGTPTAGATLLVASDAASTSDAATDASGVLQANAASNAESTTDSAADTGADTSDETNPNA
jgi:hypothetical protein